MFLPLTATEEAYIAPVVTPKIEVKTIKKPKVVHKPPTELIEKYATKYNVSSETITKIIACESGYNPLAVGDGGNSFGLVQIHHPSHPNITKEQAYNPDFAISFLAENLSKGKARLWTCSRILGVI